MIGDFKQISSICRKNRIDRIVVALDERRGRLPVDQLLFCRLKGINVDDGMTFTENLLGKLCVESLHPSSIIFSNGIRGRFYTSKLKRVSDIISALFGLLFLGPIFTLIAMAIKLDSKGPVFYRQDRVGRDGRVFSLIKFRSMVVDAEKDGPIWAVLDDQRCTRVGKIIRKLRLDEIPQLINVLKGEMSIVGPRPERPFFVKKLENEIPFYYHRHLVKPGVTGWAQIYYPYGATIEDAIEKLKYDLYYVKNMSPVMDLRIVSETVKIVLLGKGSR
ncbi:MAG: TIGR03013 family PEP-CTERM/XrtA system glycosyltransferase [Deltaproteobacteria bacterium]|nr:TIGR03013 family PEP-CTERM/XrtA system glycosyltransferase [Deltaproteobacteria bacterium]